MSGRKQHFIPQLLLRGFAAGHGKKSTQVYVFSAGKAPFLTATDRVAAQRDFYSEPSSKESLDDKITKYEGSFLAPAIENLRNSASGPIDADIAAAAIVHLSIRSAFLRGSFSIAGTEVLAQFSKALESEEETRTLIGLDSIASDSVAIKTIREELEKVLPGGVGDAERAFLVKLMHFRGREKFSKGHSSIWKSAASSVEILTKQLPNIAVNGHGKFLSQDLVPRERFNSLQAMRWRIFDAPQGTRFVLPDCLAIASKNSEFEQVEPYALIGVDELHCVVMPVSAGKVLVGSLSETQIDVMKLNENFAHCSMDFFISSQNNDEMLKVHKLIGTSINNFVGGVVENTFAPMAKDTNFTVANKHERTMLPVPVKFEPSARKSGKAQALLRNLLGEPMLREGMRLVENVVATDSVVQSLRSRGQQVDGVFAQSVMLGTCQVVEKNGHVICQLFIPNSLIDLVLRSGPEAAGASRLIRHQAGRATYFAHLSSAIAVEHWASLTSELIRAGLLSSQRIASHYFGARLSTVEVLSVHEVDQAIEFWKNNAAACAQEVNRARRHLIQTNDVNQALPHAWLHAELFLTSTAVACAAVSGDLEKLTEAALDCVELSDLPLDDWLVLFARDLERHYDSRACWVDDQSLRLLAMHLERLLWGFGVVLSDEGPSQVRMNALPDEAIAQVHAGLRA